MKVRTLAPSDERVEVVGRRARSICERGPGVDVDADLTRDRVCQSRANFTIPAWDLELIHSWGDAELAGIGAGCER